MLGQINEHSDYGMNHQGLATARPTCLAYVDSRKRENSYFFKYRKLLLHLHVDVRTVWLLLNLSLVGELCLRDGKNAAFL